MVHKVLLTAIALFIAATLGLATPRPASDAPLSLAKIEPTPEIAATPTIMPTTKPVATKPKPTTTPLIDCTGPDGKHTQSTKVDCDNLNAFWKSHTPTVSPNIGGSATTTTQTSTAASSNTSSTNTMTFTPTTSISSSKPRGSKLMPGESFQITANYSHLPSTGQTGCTPEGKVQIEFIYYGTQMQFTQLIDYGYPWTTWTGEPKVILAYADCGGEAKITVTMSTLINPYTQVNPFAIATIDEHGTPNTIALDKYELSW